MSDERLRELERSWKETGAVEDEAAYLTERVRVGDLARERLELAAHCGHEAARTASRVVGLLTASEPRELEHLGAALCDIEPWSALVGALALCELIADAGGEAADDHNALCKLLASYRMWLRCPCDSCFHRVEEARRELDAAKKHSWGGLVLFERIEAPLRLSRLRSPFTKEARAQFLTMLRFVGELSSATEAIAAVFEDVAAWGLASPNWESPSG